MQPASVWRQPFESDDLGSNLVWSSEYNNNNNNIVAQRSTPEVSLVIIIRHVQAATNYTPITV